MKLKKNICNTFFVASFLLILFSTSVGAQVYQVKPGDSLYLISHRFGTPAFSLKASNNLATDLIYPGQTLVIPSKYSVRPGDSLYMIASRYSLPLETVRYINNIWGNNLQVGQTLYLPSSQASNPQPEGNLCTVRSMDTLYLLARRYGTSIQAIKSANNLVSDLIYPGQRLIIPTGSTVEPTPEPTNPKPGNSNGVSQSDIELLARLVRAEAEGESYVGQVAVAATVLNRLKDPRFPNTIREIVYQVENGRYYQYSPVMDGRINLPATATTLKAVHDALNNWDPSYGAIGFYNPVTASSSWVRSHPVTTVIGNHVFYKN